MIPILGTALVVAGIGINLAAPVAMILPDLSGSLLIASLAARRRHWTWALPLLLLHDLTLYWSVMPMTLLFTIAALLLVMQVDMRLGAALPQRIAMVMMAHIPMWIEGWSHGSIALSFLLTVALWYWIREQATTFFQTETLQPEQP